MNEAQTRLNKIDPKLRDAGWGIVPGSKILVERAPRILFISDRNILANQAINDFDQFPEDAMCRVTPKELRKNNYKVPTARNLYFTIFQTMMTSPNAQKAEEQGIKLPEGSEDQPYYMQYERDFFDFIIIDECHRGGANDESEWRKLMPVHLPSNTFLMNRARGMATSFSNSTNRL